VEQEKKKGGTGPNHHHFLNGRNGTWTEVVKYNKDEGKGTQTFKGIVNRGENGEPRGTPRPVAEIWDDGMDMKRRGVGGQTQLNVKCKKLRNSIGGGGGRTTRKGVGGEKTKEKKKFS